MSAAQSRIWPGLLKPVLEEFGITGDVQTISGGECRLECATKDAGHCHNQLARMGWDVLSVTGTCDDALESTVIWFRARTVTP